MDKCRWFQSRDGTTYLSLCDAIWAHQFEFDIDKVVLDDKPCKKCGKPMELVKFVEAK